MILAVGLVVTSCLRQGKQNVTYDFTPLDSIISTWMDKGYYPGGAICVIKNDSVLFEKTYGSFTGDTKVYVASAGKWVAAAVIGAVTSLPACSPGGQLQSFGFGCHRDIAFGYCFCTGNSI